MKKLFLACIIVLTVASVNAQDKAMSSGSSIIFSIGVEPSLPIGDFHDIGYNFGIGGSLQGEYKADSDLGITLNAGYLNYSGKDYTIGGYTYNGGNYGIVPVMAGIKYYFSPKVYGHGQLGISIGTSKGASSNFTYSPGVGFYISNNLDLLLKYVGISGKGGGNLNSIGARLAYNFGG
jgi:hypothetical protein